MSKLQSTGKGAGLDCKTWSPCIPLDVGGWSTPDYRPLFWGTTCSTRHAGCVKMVFRGYRFFAVYMDLLQHLKRELTSTSKTSTIESPGYAERYHPLTSGVSKPKICVIPASGLYWIVAATKICVLDSKMTLVLHGGEGYSQVPSI